jgi:Na+/glutamate symporter
MSNGERLNFNMGTIKLLVIFIIIYLATGLLFKYLIKDNKIKSSKITRIFYTDDEKFIKNWEKSRKKHKFMYILYNFIINSIVILVTYIICLVLIGNKFNLPLFCGLLIGNIIVLPFIWTVNEEKYYNLLNNKL